MRGLGVPVCCIQCVVLRLFQDGLCWGGGVLAAVLGVGGDPENGRLSCGHKGDSAPGVVGATLGCVALMGEGRVTGDDSCIGVNVLGTEILGYGLGIGWLVASNVGVLRCVVVTVMEA